MHDPTVTADPPTAEPTAGDTAVPPAAGTPPAGAPPIGFELLEEIGRGGMGAVYRARDLALDREVAVKVLQERYAPESGVARRFVEEARITGQLQHPGIPAVYQCGTLPDGRPFLAMKLIKGRTLDQLLKVDGPGASRWLGTFEGICHAVGYAHARRVIHRDLKPHNVMVGAFGEVQVMDWGLAKVLAPGTAVAAVTEAESADTMAASEIRSARDSDGSFTQAGSVLGTPAFMSPEQAAGEAAKVDQRSDVFGLGAILCALLTGKPPYEGDSPDSIRIAAVRGKMDAAFARLDGCGADPEVVSLCKRCLSFEPADRPPSGDAVAKAVADLRHAADDRAKEAERDRLAAEVREGEQRKRRRALQWAGGAVAAVLLVGVLGTTWGLLRAEDKRRDAETALEEKGKALDEKEVARKAEEAAKTAAQHAQATAEEKRKDAERARVVTTEQRRLALDTVRDVLLRVDDLMKNDGKLAPLRVEIIRRMLESVDRIRDHALKNPLEDRTEGTAYTRMGDVYFNAGRIADARLWYGKAFAIFEKLAKDAPDDLNTLRNLAFASDNLANAEWRFGNGPRSLELRRAALSLRSTRAERLRADPKVEEIDRASAEMDVAEALNLLAYDELRIGDPAAAVEHYLASDRAFAALPPPLPNMLRNRRTRLEIKVRLADAYSKLGRLDAAEKLYRETIADREELLKTTRPPAAAAVVRTDIGQSRMYLGDFLLMYRKERKAALGEFVLCRDLFAEQFKASPDSLDLQQRLGATYYRLGMATDDPTKAAEAFAESLTLREALAKIDPKDAQSGVEYALSLARVGKDADAVRVVNSLLRHAPKDPQVLFQTACALAVVAGVSNDKATVADCRDRAFGILGDLLTAGWKDRGGLETDPDFNPIRDDPRFRKILDTLPASPAKEK